MKTHAAFIVSLLSAPIVVLADDWVTVSSSQNGDVTAVDAMSIQPTGSTVTYQSRLTLKRPVPDGDRPNAKSIAWVVMEYKASCADRTITQLGFVSYDSSGAVVAAERRIQPQTRAVIPGTAGEQTLMTVCDVARAMR